MASKIIPRLVGRLVCITLLILSACHDSKYEPSDLTPGRDNYEGLIKLLELTVETAGLDVDECTLFILTPENSIISRKCSHLRKADVSTFSMDRGLKEGDYRLLYISYPLDEPLDHDGRKITEKQFGLGSLISVGKKEIAVSGSYSASLGFAGKGTQDDPYIISSYDHLCTLAHKVNSDVTNGLITENTWFSQVVDIDMDDACFFTDHRYGWEPIGNDTNVPFRGIYQGKTLKNVWSLRDNSPAVGLFGYIHRARIDGVRIENGEFSGNFGVGAIAGASITAGAKRDRAEISNCRIVNSKVKGSKGSVAVGGILGVVDLNASIMLYECHNEHSSVEGEYGIGGILGTSAAYSLSSINNCSNSGSVRSSFSGAGGVVGTCDTIYITSCKNFADITGGAAYKKGDASNGAIGTGGIVGGAGPAFLTGCQNSGNVSGLYGVGGVLGSTRIKGNENSPLLYNNAAFRYCSNSGSVSGEQMVGGINGESQFGSFAVINSESVTGDSYVGGIVGNTSIAVAHNAVNSGKVTGKDYVGGILGKTTFASLALDDNFGEVAATGHHTGGIVALAGNNTVLHYCGNHGLIDNQTGNYVGGLAGEIGDPREWTGMNIAECVVGAAEIVMAIAGPCISFAEHALEESLHAVSLILKYGEFAFDTLLHATDLVLWSDSLAGLVSGESAEEVSASIQTETYDLANQINKLLETTRGSASLYTENDLSLVPMFRDRCAYLGDHVNWYAQTGNDDIFNESINETRMERMEANEKVEHTREIVAECIGGVCLVAGTVASIGAMVASGGTAAALITVGVATSVVGGVNAIVKTCTEFENNTVVISQCVNSGNLKANDRAGALVGSLQDASEIRDCLVIGSGTGSEKTFCGHFGKRATARRCLNGGTGWNGHDTGHDGTAVIRKDGAGASDGSFYEWNGGNIMYIDGKFLNTYYLYKELDLSWDVSDSKESKWCTTPDNVQGKIYIIPAHSEMRH